MLWPGTELGERVEDDLEAPSRLRVRPRGGRRAVGHDGGCSGNVNPVADLNGAGVTDGRRERRVGGDEAALH